VITAFESNITLTFIDESWKVHLRAMDDLKQEVQNASYEQKDPLLIYKLESYNLFKSMVSETNKEICSFLFKGRLPESERTNVRETKEVRRTDMNKLKTRKDEMVEVTAGQSAHQNGRGEMPNEEMSKPKLEPVRVGPKTGRNEPCPCGSGKKYKACHGA
jgi:preprotein translocase subunit SecA